MIESFKDYWWAILAVAITTFLVRRRFIALGGNEHFLRRLLYAFWPNTDPTNEKRSKLSIGIVTFAVIGIAIAMIASLLPYFLQPKAHVGIG